MQFGCAEAAGIRAWIAPAAAMMLSAMAQGAAAQGALPPGFVYLRDVEPSIAQDMRYAGSDNFVGRPLPGYGAAECVLRKEVAAALQRVQAALRAGGLSLKVYDCYRPMRAVRAMVQWVNDGRAEAPTKRFFPKLRKGSLLSGYIASQSRHSTGNTIDLTLTKVDAAPAAPFDPAATYGPCTAPPARRQRGELQPITTGRGLSGGLRGRTQSRIYWPKSSDASASFHFTDSPARKRANVASSS